MILTNIVTDGSFVEMLPLVAITHQLNFGLVRLAEKFENPGVGKLTINTAFGIIRVVRGNFC